MDPVVSPVVSSMSHSEVSRPKRKAKIVKKRTLGPEDGYNFKVEETFVLRGAQPLPEVAVRKTPRPAPHRALKAAASKENKADSDSNQDPAKRNTTGNPSPLQTSLDSLLAMPEREKEPSPLTAETVFDERNPAEQPLSMQVPANDESTVTGCAKDAPPSTTKTLSDHRKTDAAKDNLSVPDAVTNTAASTAFIPGYYADSEDGGVQLPTHTDTSTMRGIVFGGQVDSDSDSPSDSPGLETPEVVLEAVDVAVSCLECCGST